MAVWTSFMDLVHLLGAVGSAALVMGFAADGETARAVFYAVLAVAFTVALAHRRAQRRTGATPTAPVVVDLRPGPSAATVRAGDGGTATGAGDAEPGPRRPAA
ncbi:hypothetical protein [Kineococcus esterisolvens]|uniref:hypothetical protein n=1 Tax=unclassified Kineococcus TaxID=2621656 RepID=UPI003D7E0BD8